jgi:ketosteroid isomerase-like protein
MQTTTALSTEDVLANEAVLQRWVQAARAADWKAASALYAPDAILMPPNHPEVRGRDAIAEFLSHFPPLKRIDG